MTTQATECVHHWIIATPKGPMSRGRCKRCKAVKQFANSVDLESKNINLFRGPKTNESNPGEVVKPSTSIPNQQVPERSL